MSECPNILTVFTKPWKMPLPEAVKILADHGVQIASIAGPTDETTIAACAEAGVPIIRICVTMNDDDGYMAAEAERQREYDKLVPLLEKHGVTLGIQNHCGLCVANAMGMLHLIEKYDPKHVAAVWDPAHCALDGERPEIAIDILWSHLCMVNLKNAIWQRATFKQSLDVEEHGQRKAVDRGTEAEVVEWRSYWTSGRQGLCHWPTVAAELKKRSYSGPICLTAEYSDHDSVDRLIAADLAFAKALFS